MNLSKLPKTKAYLQPTRDNLIRIANLFGVNPKGLPKAPAGLNDQERFAFFMRLITANDRQVGFPPCPICNGPQRQEMHRARNVIAGAFFPEGVYCVAHPNHTVAYNMAKRTVYNAVRNAKLIIPDGKEIWNTPEAEDLALMAIMRALGPICEHEHFKMDCPDCKEKLAETWEEKQAIAVGEAVMA